MKTKLSPDVFTCVAPGSVTDEIATLSVATTLNEAVWVGDEVLNSIVVSSALKLWIEGATSSILLIERVICSVEVFPVLSTTVAVNASVEDPKPKSS